MNAIWANTNTSPLQFTKEWFTSTNNNNINSNELLELRYPLKRQRRFFDKRFIQISKQLEENNHELQILKTQETC